MSAINIQQVRPVIQVAKDGLFTMQGISRTRLIHRIIREYGKYFQGSYAVNLNEIDNCDLKLLLSYVLESEELEEIHNCPIKLYAHLNENSDHIQDLIDYECYEVYLEDQEEARWLK